MSDHPPKFECPRCGSGGIEAVYSGIRGKASVKPAPTIDLTTGGTTTTWLTGRMVLVADNAEMSCGRWEGYFCDACDYRLPVESADPKLLEYYLVTPRFFRVHWTKTYVASGVMDILATSEAAALRKADEMVGDMEGSMQYLPDQNTFEVEELKEEKK